MKLLFVDLETDGLDPKTNNILEVGYAVWDTDSRRILEVAQMQVNHNIFIPQKITEINGLNMENLTSGGNLKPILTCLRAEMLSCDYIVGHNYLEFDGKFIEEAFKKVEIPGSIKPIIDTRTDLPLTHQPKSHSLGNLIVDHEFLNYYPHTAIGDVLATIKLFSKYPLEKIIERSIIPNIKIEAVVSIRDKDKAKSKGFHWDPQKKIWHTTLKQSDYKKDNYDFETRVIS